MARAHQRANTALPDDGLYMGINIPEVERQKASKALNCDRQCPLWVKSRHFAVQTGMSALPPNSGHQRSDLMSFQSSIVSFERAGLVAYRGST